MQKNHRIAAALAKAGLSQRSLAVRTGMSESYLSNLFRLGRAPSKETAEIIAAALGCDPKNLFPAVSSHKAKNTIRGHLQQAKNAEVVQ